MNPDLDPDEHGALLRRIERDRVDGHDDEQPLRFLGRAHDPLKQWKSSPMNLESRCRCEACTKAKEAMLDRTNLDEAHRWVDVVNVPERC